MEDLVKPVLLDCTLRDGGYYNSWDFSSSLIEQYLVAMQSAEVNVVELGFRSIATESFKGACAYTTDSFLESLDIPSGLQVAVMVNASELVLTEPTQKQALTRLFPKCAKESVVDLVRIACHVHEFSDALPAANWLKEKGFKVGFNLMQIADRSEDEVKSLSREAAQYPLDVLYFADSMGSMNPQKTEQVINWLRSGWQGPIGIHTHDNLGLALSNTLQALDSSCTWVDATVTGMGRGPGNAKLEELAIELAERKGKNINIVPLMTVIRQHFRPMQMEYGWGTNPYYYLAGKHGIHPTYIQEMLGDSRYSDEDLLSVIDHLRAEGGKKFSLDTLSAARHFYLGEPHGNWEPKSEFSGREVLLLGSGPGVQQHCVALEQFIRKRKPLVLALNTQREVSADLIDFRVACHPVRLLADCKTHTKLPQPLITPYSMLPEDVQKSLERKTIFDFGLKVCAKEFEFAKTWCTVPTSLVVAYALAVSTSGGATKVFMAGFDGYGADDARSKEMQGVLDAYQQHSDSLPLVSITQTRYNIAATSVYAL